MRYPEEVRQQRAKDAVAEGLRLYRAGDVLAAHEVLSHAVHGGVMATDVMAEIVAQTGGTL